MYKFKEVLQFLNNIPYINHGGCAIAALSIHRWLNKYGIKSSIIYCYRDSDDLHYSLFIDYLNTNPYGLGRPAGCAHAFIKIGKQLFDSRGRVKKHTYSRFIEISEKSAVTSLQYENDWNGSFNRRHIAKIEKFLEISLNDIKKSTWCEV